MYLVQVAELSQNQVDTEFTRLRRLEHFL
jgi:hypothetical protein